MFLLVHLVIGTCSCDDNYSVSRGSRGGFFLRVLFHKCGAFNMEAQLSSFEKVRISSERPFILYVYFVSVCLCHTELPFEALLQPNLVVLRRVQVQVHPCMTELIHDSCPNTLGFL